MKMRCHSSLRRRRKDTSGTSGLIQKIFYPIPPSNDIFPLPEHSRKHVWIVQALTSLFRLLNVLLIRCDKSQQAWRIVIPFAINDFAFTSKASKTHRPNFLSLERTERIEFWCSNWYEELLLPQHPLYHLPLFSNASGTFCPMESFAPTYPISCI